MMTAQDFETRYGSLIDIDDLARLVSASRREMQATLRAHNIDVVTIGSRQLVPAHRVAAAFGLTQDDAEVAEMAKTRREMSTRADGSTKSVREYVADSRPRAVGSARR
jgi:hypothetical protein